MIVAEPAVPESHVKPRLIGEIESFLSGLVADMASEPQPARGPGRPAILPALALWAGLLVLAALNVAVALFWSSAHTFA